MSKDKRIRKKCQKCNIKYIKSENTLRDKLRILLKIRKEQKYCRKCWCEIKPLSGDKLLKSCGIPEHLWDDVKSLTFEGQNAIRDYNMDYEKYRRFLRKAPGLLYDVVPRHEWDYEDPFDEVPWDETMVSLDNNVLYVRARNMKE